LNAFGIFESLKDSAHATPLCSGRRAEGEGGRGHRGVVRYLYMASSKNQENRLC